MPRLHLRWYCLFTTLMKVLNSSLYFCMCKMLMAAFIKTMCKKMFQNPFTVLLTGIKKEDLKNPLF